MVFVSIFVQLRKQTSSKIPFKRRRKTNKHTNTKTSKNIQEDFERDVLVFFLCSEYIFYHLLCLPFTQKVNLE
jgi:hypothetical protein